MPIDLRCEFCNQHIATISYSKLRDYIQQNGEVCRQCIDKQIAVHEFWEKKRERFMQMYDKLVQKAEAELKKEIQRLASTEKTKE